MSVVIGIFLGIAGSLAINTGNNLQSYGMHKMELEEKEESLCKSFYWVMGTVVFITGALLNFASFGFAPQSTLASLESIQFVSNILFGKWLLNKTITQKMMVGTGLTVLGTVLAVCFSSKRAAEVEDVGDLVHFWKNPVWIAYVVILVVLATVIFFAYKAIDKKGLAKEHQNWMATMYAVFSALFGTLSVVFAKLLAKLLELWAQDVNVFSEWYTYVTAVSWLALMAFWLRRLNNALSLYDPVFIIPLLQSNFIFFANVSGGIYFQEFNYMTPVMWVGFCSGVLVMFIGIFLLVPARTGDQVTEDVRHESSLELAELNPHSGKRILTYLMTGPGRMHQHQFKMKKIQMDCKRELEHLNSKMQLSLWEEKEKESLELKIQNINEYFEGRNELGVCLNTKFVSSPSEIRRRMKQLHKLSNKIHLLGKGTVDSEVQLNIVPNIDGTNERCLSDAGKNEIKLKHVNRIITETTVGVSSKTIDRVKSSDCPESKDQNDHQRPRIFLI